MKAVQGTELGYSVWPNCHIPQYAQLFSWWKWKCNPSHASGFKEYFRESQLNMIL